ncbi:glycosyltransferase family 4 protein [Pajaroellobacter abortibovis]|uniref:Glycosyl transferase family 1 domain-containing protein n=1 Tax=Pajaroellobacter abortibovis TaxID=1882918 RepID=A0A1L6MX55_9BACT|nr:glycosyltransferase family 4 protein [Pajaroellobacter abortibovis]APS00114.1 hypothetical protein BCY86_05025 [Pajaroellobacter abortibovis]
MQSIKSPQKKIRVLFLNDTARNGGPGRSLATLLGRLDTDRIERLVLLPREGVIADHLRTRQVADQLIFLPQFVENPIEPWNRSIERSDFDALWFQKAYRFAGNMVRGALSIQKIAALAEEKRCHLLYCNGTSANFAGALASLLDARLPVLWHARYTSIAKPLAPLHRALTSTSIVRKIVCVSRATADLFDFCREKVRVVHNAIETDEFMGPSPVLRLRSGLHLSAETCIFGSHGRILPSKGYKAMIEAAHLALQKMSPEEQNRCHFVILGDTPDDFRINHLAECQSLAHELGIAHKVSFLGFQSDIRPFIGDIDVAVVPSLYPDPFPRSVLESMALAKPVIAFNLGGIVEMIENGKNGTLLDSSSLPTQSLAAAYLMYLRNPLLRKEQGEAGRKKVLEQFDAKTHAEIIQQEIFQILMS